MATAKPRITISLEPDQYEALRRLAELQKAPMSRIVSELLAEVTPVLGRLADTIETALKAQADLKEHVRSAASDFERDVNPLHELLKNQLDLFSGEISRIAEAVKDARPEPQQPPTCNHGGYEPPTTPLSASLEEK